ncbi:methyltransferase domain-containing protein [Cellulomonas sp.]|uniref:class I SAM-dependent methyltransferase n=1 Tax=Cellulomonas sp. TaxID=40001 RepID=UPI0028124DEB|nr:methyltransferase domain-containing protein [Cellulomonas sp.]
MSEAEPARQDAKVAHASSFGRGVDAYRAARPGYPDEAVRWCVPPGARDVLDLAAGTGKLTASLVALGLRVLAVEPDDAMRDALTDALPDVDARSGLAEHTWLPDACVDAVTVGQAWHWFEEPLAAAEVARVLRPGGTLAVLWNDRDESVGWVRALGDLLREAGGPPEARGRTFEPGDTFGPVERLDVRWSHPLAAGDVRRLAASRSYALVLPADERVALLDRVDELVATHPQTRGHERVDLPYVTRAYRCRLR